MPILKTIDNHRAIHSSSHVTEICNPLFNSFDISFFNFVRIYKNGNRLSLANRPDWLQHYFEQQYQNIAIFKNNKECYLHKALLWDAFKNDHVINIATENFDIAHGLTMIRKHNGYCDFFHFASQKQNIQIINTYLNYYEFLDNFTLYFTEKCYDLMKTIKPYQSVPESSHTPHTSRLSCAQINPKSYSVHMNQTHQDSGFLESIRLHKYHVQGKLGKVMLTKKQLHCLTLLADNKKTKEIANLLSVSTKTIDSYIETLMNKLGGYSRVELAQIFNKNSFPNLLTLFNNET